ncbi:MAG TPA: hypothetical protein VF103_14060 [Polyangiaceae bacterium]
MKSLERWIRRLVALPKRLSAEQWWAVALAAVALIVACRFEAFFLRYPTTVGFDDGYILSVGERLIDEHWLPYVDSYVIRGPLLYWTAALAELATGRFTWTAARLVSMWASFSTLLLLFGVGVAAKKPFAGAVAMLTYVGAVMGIVQWGGAFSLTGERVASPWATGALLFTVLALRANGARARRLLLLGAGAAAAMAGLAKQTCLPTVVPLGLWVVCAAMTRAELTRRERFGMPLALALGFIGVIAATLARYAFYGEVGRYFYWSYSYASRVYMQPYGEGTAFSLISKFFHEDAAWGVLALSLVLATSLARPLLASGPSLRALARGYDAVGLEATAALLGFILFSAALAPLRFWPHYFVASFPFLSLVAGLRSHQYLFTRDSRRRVAAQVVGGGLFAAFVVLFSSGTLEGYLNFRRAGGWGPPRPEPVCAAFDRHARPNERVFVWGFNADLYITCRRHPSTRFTVLTMVAGVIPPFWSDVRDEYVSKHGREDLIEDLERERPPVIVDTNANMDGGGSREGGLRMQDVPKVAPYLTSHYCQAEQTTAKDGRAIEIWVRGDLPACRAPNSQPLSKTMR